VTELPYFRNGINFMAPQTDLPAVWDSYQNVVENLRAKGLTEGITINSQDRCIRHRLPQRYHGSVRDLFCDQGP
jgi:hypothetical protein